MESGRVYLFAEGYNLRASFLSRALKRLLLPHMTVAVIAFSFRDSMVRSAEDFDRFYGIGSKNYQGITAGLSAYGISPERISFVNYFTDTPQSAAEKLRNADVLYFPGGVPDRMMERIHEFHLEEIIRAHQGLLIGYSAGALVFLSEYHLSPDHDYPVFQYGKGLGMVEGFYFEPHYTACAEQVMAIRRVRAEKNLPVYVLPAMKGALLVENGTVLPLGKAEEYGEEVRVRREGECADFLRL